METTHNMTTQNTTITAHIGAFINGFVRGTSTTLKVLGYTAEAVENVAINTTKKGYKKVLGDKEQSEMMKNFSEGWNQSEELLMASEDAIKNTLRKQRLQRMEDF